MGNFLVPIIVIGALVSMYIITYVLNKRTPIPEECLTAVDETKCESCHSFTCTYKGKE
jgi:hypothetical protein